MIINIVSSFSMQIEGVVRSCSCRSGGKCYSVWIYNLIWIKMTFSFLGAPTRRLERCSLCFFLYSCCMCKASSDEMKPRQTVNEETRYDTFCTRDWFDGKMILFHCVHVRVLYASLGSELYQRGNESYAVTVHSSSSVSSRRSFLLCLRSI